MKIYYIQINDEPSWNDISDLLGNTRKESKEMASDIAKKLGHKVYFVPIFKTLEEALESVPEELLCDCGCKGKHTVAEIDVPEFNFPDWD